MSGSEERFLFRGCRLTTALQNKELRSFYLGNQQDAAQDEAPARLDRLLRRDCCVDHGLEAELQGLSSEQLEFLKFGLAYHISRRAGSVRLSTKAHVKIAKPASCADDEAN
jgi:hypothetical protein